jgi:hypothetical protein
MSISSEQYDRVARWLDGQDVALDAQELELADQVRNGLSSIGAAFEAAMPPGAIQRAIGSLPQRRPAIIRLAPYIGAAAAAAAAIIVLAVGFGQHYTPRQAMGPAVAQHTVKPAPAVAGVVGIKLIIPKDVDLDVIAGEVDELQASMTAPPATVDVQIDAVQSQLEQLQEDHPLAKPFKG